MAQPSCADCHFGEPDAGTDYPIYCRRFPPKGPGLMPDANGMVWMTAFWPEVDHSDWCGEFKRRAKEPPRAEPASHPILISDVVNAAGGMSALATALGISAQAICQWHRVPPTRVIEVEKITGISRHDLRPDIYGKSLKNDGGAQ